MSKEDRQKHPKSPWDNLDLEAAREVAEKLATATPAPEQMEGGYTPRQFRLVGALNTVFSEQAAIDVSANAIRDRFKDDPLIDWSTASEICNSLVPQTAGAGRMYYAYWLNKSQCLVHVIDDGGDSSWVSVDEPEGEALFYGSTVILTNLDIEWVS